MAFSNDTMALCMLVDLSAEQAREAGQRLSRERAQAARAAEIASAASMVSDDIDAAKVAGGLCITVVVPFLIGHFLTTKILKSNRAVYDDRARGIWDHFFPTYLAGVIPIALCLVLFVVLRMPWRHRMITVVPSLILLAVISTLLLPLTVSKWNEAELTTVTKLRTTAFPFRKFKISEHCASWEFVGENGLRQEELWQVHLGGWDGNATVVKDNIRFAGCRAVYVYRGWLQVGRAALPSGDVFTGDITVNHPGWDNPYTGSVSDKISIYNRATKTTIHMNPIATRVDLPTTDGRVMSFTLDGAGFGDFRLHY